MQTTTHPWPSTDRKARRAAAVKDAVTAIMDNGPGLRRPLVYAIVHRLSQLRRELDHAKARDAREHLTRQEADALSDIEQEALELTHTLRPGFELEIDDRPGQPAVSMQLPDGRWIMIP